MIPNIAQCNQSVYSILKILSNQRSDYGSLNTKREQSLELTKMADEVIEKEAIWFSSELRMLEAEFEKSKLQVFQDTLLCKRSMVELDLLWKNERLRKNVRVNNKLKEKDSRLQV